MAKSKKVRVGLIGYGVIGKRVAAAVAQQKDMTLADVPKPSPGPGQVLIKISSSLGARYGMSSSYRARLRYGRFGGPHDRI